MAHAARLGDAHTCPLATPHPHAGGTIAARGSATVEIGGKYAATRGSVCTCGPGPVNEIVKGSRTVIFNRKPAARVGDPTTHGGLISRGCGSVLIG